MINLLKDSYDFNGRYSKTYISKCENCGKEHKVSTQDDDCAEYDTNVYIMCDCGNSVEFILPVN